MNIRHLAAAVAALAAVAGTGPAQADARIDQIMEFCRTDTAIPPRTTRWLDIAPDGNIRGPRQAAVLYAEARNAVRAGGRENELQGVRWILLCVRHDDGSYQHVANNNQAVIDYLRTH